MGDFINGKTNRNARGLMEGHDVSIVPTFRGIQQCFLQRVVLEELHTRFRYGSHFMRESGERAMMVINVSKSNSSSGRTPAATEYRIVHDVWSHLNLS